ncbi:30S ribosomal S5 [Chlorella sorokiniana]|uniref:30S ribosomal S5 n=1 Tax=Chlorella sorokiniana TaxID=3076 RepID=A0A2P6TS13_CHLSO|nr:30S ribosomal S5 [Chlorella sorokiniana]|eukprot:PRW56846.1 30S ribosomal S5 [Chlorella sorokiniana]
MLPRLLQRAVRQAAAGSEPLGSIQLLQCGPGGAPLAQLTSLLGWRVQQAAGYAAHHRGDAEDEEEELAAAAHSGRPHRHSKLSHSARRQLIERKLAAAEEEAAEAALEEEAEALMEDLKSRTPVSYARRQQIRSLLSDLGRDAADDSAAAFVTSFFGERQQADYSRLASAAGISLREKPLVIGHGGRGPALAYRGEGGRYAPPKEPLAASSDEELEAEEGDEDEEAMQGALEVAVPEELDEGEQFDLMSKLQGLRPGSRRIVLAGLLAGGILRADPQAMQEWQEIQTQFQPPDDFRMKVVDVNRTCKGTRTGGLYRYSCMVVVGNGNGVLGWGQGKAAEVNEAVQKAYQRACRNLYPIPRYNDHTITEAINAKYGQVKVVMYPKSSGTGIMANSLMREICKMAGIHDVGIKLHGSRNVRNAVKCVFKAFDKMRTEEEIDASAAQRGRMQPRRPGGCTAAAMEGPEHASQQLAAGSALEQATPGSSSEEEEELQPAAASGQPDDDAESGSDGDSGSEEGSQPAAKRPRIQDQQQQQDAAESIPQAPAAAGAVPAVTAASPVDAAAAAMAAAAVPTLPSTMELTAEQQAAVLPQFPGLSPEALAAAQAALPTGPDGQPLPLTLPLIGPDGESLPLLVVDPAMLFSTQLIGTQITGPNGEELTQEQLATLLASAAQMQFIIPLAPGQALPAGGAAAAAAAPGSGRSPPFKSWWEPQEEKELVSLVEDAQYRLKVLGARELDWSRIEAHFGGRSQNACRKKYWQLAKKSGHESDSEAELVPVDPSKKPRADRKLWEPEEAQELLRLVNEPSVRARVLHLARASAEVEMWDAIARHFECSVQTCKRKYRHATEAQEKGTLVQPGQEKAKRQHHRKTTPYRWMIVNALMALPSGQGTAPDIFQQIEANPDYQPQLDTRIMPGTKHIPRWKIQVRKVLSSDKVFQHTGLKQKSETVWRLDQHELREAQASSKAVISPHPAAHLLAGLSTSQATRKHGKGGAAAAAAAATGAGLFDGRALSPEQIQAALQQAGLGTAVVPVEVAQEVALVQQQIAAAIAAGPVVVPPEQLQEMAAAIQAAGSPLQPAEAVSADQAQPCPK